MFSIVHTSNSIRHRHVTLQPVYKTAPRLAIRPLQSLAPFATNHTRMLSPVES